MMNIKVEGREYRMSEQAYRACGQVHFEIVNAYHAIAEDIESGEMVLLGWDMLPGAIEAEGTPDAWLPEDACDWDRAYIVA